MSMTMVDEDEPVNEQVPTLTPALQGHIGSKLRAVYGELVREPIPDKFAKLLEELARKQQSQKPDNQE